MKNEFIIFLRGISDYFENISLTDGKIICPKHRIEHTGKNAYSAIIDSELYKLTGEEKYFERAKKRVLRLTQNLVQDPEHGGWIFWPGRLGKYNMSNSVIDCGGAVDSLASFYFSFREKINNEEKNKILNAIERVSDTYLVKAVVSKEITNQRLWGGAGLASAYRIFKKEAWKNTLLESLEKSFSEMLDDGVFPYHPRPLDYDLPEGAADTSSFYHSSHLVYTYLILEDAEISPQKYKPEILKAAKALVGFYQENGVKNINLEAKRWYFLSSYEIASNVFDVYTFWKTYSLFGGEDWLYCAVKALDKIFSHQMADGGIIDNFEKQNFQCRIFWNAHIAWLAKIIGEIDFEKMAKAQEPKEYTLYFPKADFIKHKNEKYCIIARGRKKPADIVWGARVGGGSLLYFGRKENNWENELKYKEWSNSDPLNFYFETDEKESCLSFWKKNKISIKSSLFYAWTELRAFNFKAFSERIADIFKKLWIKNALYASHFSPEVKTLFDAKNNSVVFQTIPSRRNGALLKGAELTREYCFGKEEMKIKEKVEFDDKKIKTIYYYKKAPIKDLRISSNVPFEERNDVLVFWPNGGGKIEIIFSLS